MDNTHTCKALKENVGKVPWLKGWSKVTFGPFSVEKMAKNVDGPTASNFD